MEDSLHRWFVVLSLLTAVSLHWTSRCVRADDSQGVAAVEPLLSDVDGGDAELDAAKRFSALSGDLGKRLSNYRLDLGKRSSSSSFYETSRDASKRYRMDLGKRAPEQSDAFPAADEQLDPASKRYNFDLGKRFNFDLGKRYNFDLGKRYKFDLGKRYNFDLGKRDGLEDDDSDVSGLVGGSKRYSSFKADLGKRTVDEHDKRFRFDLGKRAAFRADLGKRSRDFIMDSGRPLDINALAAAAGYSPLEKRPMSYRVDLGKRYNFDLGKRSAVNGWKRLFRTDLGR